MRICLLAHNFRNDNGTGVFARRLVRGLEENLGAEVVPLTALGGGIPAEQTILYPSMFKLLFTIPRVRRIVKSCDAVHALDLYPYGIVATLAAYGLKKKIILTAVGTGSLKVLYHSYPPLTWLARWSYGQASAVTAISRFTRDAILERVPHLAVRVINPGIDHERFLGVDNGRAERGEATILDSTGRSHTVKSLTPYILSVGALRHRKGYHISIRAFAKIAKTFPNLKYVIVGKQYGRPYYEKMIYHIRRLGLEGRVVILDTVRDERIITRLYRGAELFFLFPLPSGYDVEGFGIVFLEAAASGLPIVAARTGGVEDAVDEGRNAILVPAGDLGVYSDSNSSDPFAEAIKAILESTALRKRMSEASVEFAAKSRWEARIREYLDIYRSFLWS